jgi:YVTN family beta-propeller protein
MVFCASISVMSKHAAMMAVLALVLACACNRAPSPPKGPLAYVSDEENGQVVVVDIDAARVVKSIAVGKRPRGLKLSRDGQRLYVALSGSPRGGPGIDESKLPPPDRSADGIGVVDLATGTLSRILESGADPEAFDISPDGATLYVSNEDTAEMSALDLATGKLRGRAHVGGEPEGVTVSADGKVVFVTCEADNEVDAIDTTTLNVIAKMPTAPRPRSLILTRDGRTAFVPTENSRKVTVLDTIAYKPLGDIDIHLDSPKFLGPRPMGGVLSRDGTQLYVTTGRGGSVAIIDVASRKQVRSIEGVGDRPWGIALSRDGTHLYTANGTSHDLGITNIATGNVDRRVFIGGLPWGVVLRY